MKKLHFKSFHRNKPNETNSRMSRVSPATFWVALGALAITLPIIMMGVAVIIFQVFQLILPGVMIFDTAVGSLNIEDTARWVDRYWNQDRQITLITSENPGLSFTFSPADLGLWVDPEATAHAAFQLGRDSDPFPDILASLTGQTQIVLPVIYFDEHTARSTLQSLAQEMDYPPKDAQIKYQDDTWIAVPGSDGEVVNIEGMLNTLYQDAFDLLQGKNLLVEIRTVPPALEDLTPVLDEIETLLAQDFRFEAYDPINDEHFQWTVPSEIKKSWVKINAQSQQVGFVFDQKGITELTGAWENSLGEGRGFETAPDPEDIIEHWESNQPYQVEIRHDPTAYQVGVGESLWAISLKLGMPMWYIMDANEGLTSANISPGMTLNIPSKNDLLPLPVIWNKRIIIDISEQRMYVYENGNLRNTHIVSTGVSDSPTMAGIFQVRTHEINAYASNWDLWMPHFMGIYEAWPDFMNGIHGLPLLASGQRLWASALGTPASYGCIILDLEAAEDLYYWADPGVVVEIIK